MHVNFTGDRNVYCGYDEFHCANDKCIVGNKRCDGKNNCGDNSDEKDCGMFYIVCFHLFSLVSNFRE
jgi:hypothetical protein